MAVRRLNDEGLERLVEVVVLRGLPEPLLAGAFLTNLVERILRRYPALQDLDLEDEEDGPEELPLEDLAGGEAAAADYVMGRLAGAVEDPYLPLLQEITRTGADQPMSELMKELEKDIRIKSIIRRFRKDPEWLYPELWGKIWMAIPKWDGRSFRAYTRRVVRNYLLDAPKDSPSLEIDPPSRHTSHVNEVFEREAQETIHVLIEGLEQGGAIKAIDGVIFDLIAKGQEVKDMMDSFASPLLDRMAAAFDVLGRPLEASDVVVLDLLIDGLTGSEVALITGRDATQVGALAAALGQVSEEEQTLAKVLLREGIRTADLRRAQKMTRNAISLRINRGRLRVWMGLVDRGYENLRRREAIDDDELGLVRHRCVLAPRSGCRMYKDATCKAEAEAQVIGERTGIDPAKVPARLAALRSKILQDGLDMSFPDYNGCLIQRKLPGAKGE